MAVVVRQMKFWSKMNTVVQVVVQDMIGIIGVALMLPATVSLKYIL